LFAPLGAVAVALAMTGCGKGEAQDADEPKGNFPVEVLKASFPQKQRLAERSTMRIAVKNTGQKAIPNIAVTVHGFTERKDEPDLADPERPIFVINGIPKSIGGFPESKEASPIECETAYVGTWACGELKPGGVKTFLWSVTAVEAGPYDITWQVAGGLDGKAKAVTSNGQPPRGKFAGTVQQKPPKTRVADDGKTVIEGTR
jgi:hypothetical protein